MKPEQEKEEASNVATVAWARALQKKIPKRKSDSESGRERKTKSITSQSEATTRRNEQRRSRRVGDFLMSAP